LDKRATKADEITAFQTLPLQSSDLIWSVKN